MLKRHYGTPIALRGHVIGGGSREGRLGMLGVFLDHNPSDFGVKRARAMHIGELRTGLSEAVATNLEDDSYDLSWYEPVSGEHTIADTAVLPQAA